MNMPSIDTQLTDWRGKSLKLESEVKKVIVGQDRAIRLMNIAIFARGHVLLEGGVGVGKTTLLQSITRGIGGAYERIEGDLSAPTASNPFKLTSRVAPLHSSGGRTPSSG